jgi:glycosyltransferase involved in cell wall biosynthesis
MRLAIITDDYLPLSTLVHAKMLHELALQLTVEGHEVVVITPGLPDQNARLVKNSVDGITVWRFKNGKTRGVNKITRALNETLFSFNAWRAIRKDVEAVPFDGVIYYSPSIFFGWLVRKIKTTSQCKSYLILRDLFPQWAIDEKLIRQGSLIEKYFRFFETLNYTAANTIGLMSPKNLELFDKTFDQKFSTHVLFNWADTKRPEFVSVKLNLRKNLGLEGKVIFFYGGNIGHAQDMENLMRLAVSLKDKEGFHFLFIGQGDEVDLVKGCIKRESLMNTTFLPSVSQEEFKYILRQVDIGLFSLAYSHKAHNFPGKILGYMVESLPILGSVNPGNDLSDVILSADAGYVFVNGDDNSLRDAAIELAFSNDLRKRLGANANDLLRQSFSVDSAAKSIIEHLG